MSTLKVNTIDPITGDTVTVGGHLAAQNITATGVLNVDGNANIDGDTIIGDGAPGGDTHVVNGELTVNGDLLCSTLTVGGSVIDTNPAVKWAGGGDKGFQQYVGIQDSGGGDAGAGMITTTDDWADYARLTLQYVITNSSGAPNDLYMYIKRGALWTPMGSVPVIFDEEYSPGIMNELVIQAANYTTSTSTILKSNLIRGFGDDIDLALSANRIKAIRFETFTPASWSVKGHFQLWGWKNV